MTGGSQCFHRGAGAGADHFNLRSLEESPLNYTLVTVMNTALDKQCNFTFTLLKPKTDAFK